MKLRALLLLALIVLAKASAAQITIRNASTLDPVELVNVVNLDQTFSAVSDAAGKVPIPELSDEDSLYFLHISFEPLAMSFAEVVAADYQVYLLPERYIDTILVTAPGKVREKRNEIAHKVDIISASDIGFSNAQTSADILQGKGVHIQKSQYGGGSPIIRGFEANKVLLVVDGVRMNNAIFRSGHLQNSITVDNAILEKAEVVYGPGSVIYGSDAIGGVIHYYTKRPQLRMADSGVYFTSNAYTRFASASIERSGHLDFNIGFGRWAYLSSFTYNSFGDLRSGHLIDPFYGDFGQLEYYQTRINERDTILINDDPYIQRHTGYDQWGFLQKILYRPSEQVHLLANVQYTTSTDIPRFDRMSQHTNYDFDYAEWFYGPQNRLLASLELGIEAPANWFDQFTLLGAYQDIAEERIDRRFGNLRRRTRLEEVEMVSVNADFQKKLNYQHNISYGAEYTYNLVNSSGYRLNIETNEVTTTSTRYPDGGTEVNTYAFYLKHTYKPSKRLIFSESFRFSKNTLISRFVSKEFYDFPFDEISLNNDAISGNLSLVYNPGGGWKFSLVGSSGFRAPNLDDVAKIFDSSPGTVIVPNDNLSPENAYNVEIGIEKNFDNKGRVYGTIWYTSLRDAIVRENFKFNGQDSIMYDGVLSQVQANVNSGEATVRGITAGADLRISKRVTLDFIATDTRGWDEINDEPLGHIPPLFGEMGMAYRDLKLHVRMFVRYADWKYAYEFSPSGVDNLDEATIEGSPAWYTLNLRSSLRLNSQFRVQLAVENILDLHYREFASGVSSPGRNLVLSLNGKF